MRSLVRGLSAWTTLEGASVCPTDRIRLGELEGVDVTVECPGVWGLLGGRAQAAEAGAQHPFQVTPVCLRCPLANVSSVG